MKIHKGFKFRLYPNEQQKEMFERHFGCCRWVWNHFLRKRIDHYEEHEEGLTYYDNTRSLTQLKKDPKLEWLCEVNSQSLQQSLSDLQTAYRNFFEDRAKYPQFKSKKAKQSFRVPQRFGLNGEGERQYLKLPKMTSVRIIVHRPVEGEMKSVTISKTKTGKYYASILCEVEIEKPKVDGSKPVIGIDLGLIDFAVTSGGEHIPTPKYLRKSERELKRAQRVLSRRQEGSSGWERARQRVAKLHEKIANQRRDFLHKLSTRLVRDNQAIFFEDLAVKNMMANRHLAKSISDAGWGTFLQMCKYKGSWYGCRVEQVDRFAPSSKRCSDCGFIIQSLPLSVREWTCPECGSIHDRDQNAAENIRSFGMMQHRVGTTRIDAGGEQVLEDRSEKPEAQQLSG